MEAMTITGVSDQTAAKMKAWGLQGRYVIVPGTVDKAALYLQLLPMSQADMVATFLDQNGQQVVDTNSADIPSMFFQGQEAGVGQTGLADMGPVADKLLPDTGFGILPIFLSSGGELETFPSSAAVKAELFHQLRRVTTGNGDRTQSLTPKEWETEFKKSTFPDLVTPELLWPLPDTTAQRVEDGELNIVLQYKCSLQGVRFTIIDNTGSHSVVCDNYMVV